MEDNKAMKYSNIKLTAGILKGLLTFILLFLFVYSGESRRLASQMNMISTNAYINFLLFVFVTGAAFSIIFFPISFYTGYILEHKYNLSNQSVGKYFIEKLKGLLVSAVIGIPILLLFFYIMNTFGSLWWLPFAVLMFIISVVLAQILPVLILPLFYKISPIENENLKERITKLAENAGLKVENVFMIDMSKNTKKANAAFAGLGKSKRILLGDTLLDNYTTDEIETVMAHELGHYKKNHITKNIIIGTVSSFLTLFIIAELYEMSLSWFNFDVITRIGALPLLALWGMIINLIENPITNMISRKFEYEADEYAILTTGKREAFINTLDKLTDQNLGDRKPHPLVEWYFYSHPSIKNRTEHIRSLNPA